MQHRCAAGQQSTTNAAKQDRNRQIKGKPTDGNRWLTASG